MKKNIGVIAPAGHFKGDLNKIKNHIESFGYNVFFGKSCYEKYMGYLSGDDNLRAKDINSMFLNKSIDIILCLRGGYGTLRILDLIDYEIIKNNKKPFIGFSDITALHIAFNQKSGLKTFHGPMASSVLNMDKFTYNSLLDNINDTEIFINNPKNESIKTLIKGSCKGKLTGGNLSIIVSTIGTKYEIDTKDKILFVEEINESMYKIDRMLTQLDLSGKLNDCKGIVFGDFNNCSKNSDEISLEELFLSKIKKYNKPCIYNLKSGHCMPMLTLTMGGYYKLNSYDDVKLIRC